MGQNVLDEVRISWSGSQCKEMSRGWRLGLERLESGEQSRSPVGAADQARREEPRNRT